MNKVLERFKSLFPDLLRDKIITPDEERFDQIMQATENKKVQTGHGIIVEPPREENKDGQ